MASQPLVALGVQQPEMNTLGSFQKGQEAAVQVDQDKLKMAANTLEMIGAGAMYALDGNPDGEVDPDKYAEVLDSFEGMGMDVSRFRDNPNFAKIAAQSSITAMDRLKLARDDRDFQLTLEKWQQDIEEADRSFALDREKLDWEKSRLADGPKPPAGYEWNEDGSLKAITGGPADPENPRNKKVSLTEGQAKTAGFTNRMIKAETELQSDVDENGQPVIDDADPGMSSANPFSADFWSMMNRKYGPNMTQSPEYQKFYNGAQEWVRAKLRKESGAAISSSEWESEFETYFPQPGDSKEVITQKARLRANAVESMKAESRGGYRALFEDGGEGVSAREFDVTTPDGDGYTVEEVPD